MAERIINGAVFLNGSRRYKNVDVEYDEQPSEPLVPVVRVLNRATGTELASYSIVATAKSGMAWDVEVGDKSYRLVAQTGCGCSGMKPYKEDQEYLDSKSA